MNQSKRASIVLLDLPQKGNQQFRLLRGEFYIIQNQFGHPVQSRTKMGTLPFTGPIQVKNISASHRHGSSYPLPTFPMGHRQISNKFLAQKADFPV